LLLDILSDFDVLWTTEDGTAALWKLYVSKEFMIKMS